MNNWPMTAEDGRVADLLSRGEAVPGGPGACTREGCHHLTLWHGEHGRYRDRPCTRPGCRCTGFTDERGAVIRTEPDAQHTLFDAPERAA
jgi:hypothetical protein